MTNRIGHGYDFHRLEPLPPKGKGRPFVMAGVKLDFQKGPVGHSDGDAVYHAVTDAVLGALCEPDIGQLFPDTDPKNEAADSSTFLKIAAQKMRHHGYKIGNLDITVVCEQPKISSVKSEMIKNIASLLDCEPSQVNVKGKTHEKVDAVGEGRAIEVHAVVLLEMG